MDLNAVVAEVVERVLQEKLGGPVRRQTMALTVQEAADELRVSETTMRKLIRENTIPSRKIGDRRVIARSALEAYMQEGEAWEGREPVVEDVFGAKTTRGRSSSGRTARSG